MHARILVASCSLSRRLWYRHELELVGFQLETVSSGLDCLQRLSEFRPELLILETSLSWGGADGVLEIQQADSDLGRIPVIVIDLGHDAAQTYRLGQYALASYWKRPPTPEELVETVLSALDLVDHYVNPLAWNPTSSHATAGATDTTNFRADHRETPCGW